MIAGKKPAAGDAVQRETRAPIETPVSLEFDQFSGFLKEYSANLSEGGMFIKTAQPKRVGTVFSFEFKLKDDFVLLQGWGEVRWIREKDGGPDKPGGMGVKFIDLDPASRALIAKVIRERTQSGKAPVAAPEIPPPDASSVAAETTAPVERTEPMTAPTFSAAPDLAIEELSLGGGDPAAQQFAEEVMQMSGAEAARPKAPPAKSAPLENLFEASETTQPAEPTRPAKTILPQLRAIESGPAGAEPDMERAAASPIEEGEAVESEETTGEEELTLPPRKSRRTIWPRVAAALMFAGLLAAGALYYRPLLNKAQDLYAQFRAAKNPIVLKERGSVVLNQRTAPALPPAAAPAEAEAPLQQAARPPVAGRSQARPAEAAEPSEELKLELPAAAVASKASPAKAAPRPTESKAAAQKSEPRKVAAAAPAAAKPQRAAGADQVTSISAESAGGSTFVSIEGNGPLGKSRVEATALRQSPLRLLLKISGIQTGYKRTALSTEGSPYLSRIRTGYHADKTLHIVFDLKGKRFPSYSVSEEDGALLVRFGK